MIDRAFRLAPLLFGACACLCGPSLALAKQAPADNAKAQDFKPEFDALVERYGTAADEFQKELTKLYESFDRETASADEKAAFDKKAAAARAKDPAGDFAKEFAALAERAKGTETATKSLLKVIELDRSEPGDTPASKSLATLLAEHVKAPAISSLPMAMARSRSLTAEQRTDAFKKLIRDCPVDAVKANAMYSLGNQLLNDSDGTPSAEVRQMFVDLKQKFGAIASPRGKTYGEMAEGVLFELDHLQLGMHAPDFEVVDETGAKWKLSDYKGKVVVVDFWGNW